MDPPLSRRALLVIASLAFVAAPRRLAAQSEVVELEGTVIDARSPGVACGILAVAGWATVRPTRVISGALPPGDVRLVIHCGTAPVGQHVRVRGVRISTRATHFGNFSILPPLPHDGLLTLGVRLLTVLP